MTTYYAIFDGEAFRPEGPIPLEPNTRVRVIIEDDAAAPAKDGEPYCSLDLMLSMKIDGPPDWSERFREYKYGNGCHSDE